MKIALLLSGHLNTFEYKNHHRRWIKILNKYNNIDIFCIADNNNFYDSETDSQIFSVKNSTHKVNNNDSRRRYHKIINLGYDESRNKIIKKLQNTFNNKLKKYLIYNFDDINDKTFILNNNYREFLSHDYDRRFSLLSQFYKLKECFKIMQDYEHENNFKYDIIIRSRFDVSPFDQSSLPIDSDIDQKIYTPFDNYTKHINDWIVIGNREIMSKYCHYIDSATYLTDTNYSHNLYLQNNIWMLHSAGFNISTPNISTLNVADSSEVGLTYLISENRYEIIPFHKFILDNCYN